MATFAPTIGSGRARGSSNNLNQDFAVTTPSSGRISSKTYGGDSIVRQTIITLDDVPISITDAAAYGSVKIGDFPQTVLGVNGCVAKSLAFTTTSTLASTLNASSAVQFGVGSAAASATTLATTMLSFAPGTGQTVPTFTSSATVNVAATAVNSHLLASVILDGHTTAIPMYLNLAIGTGADIDGDATLTVDGTIIVTWTAHGDY